MTRITAEQLARINKRVADTRSLVREANNAAKKEKSLLETLIAEDAPQWLIHRQIGQAATAIEVRQICKQALKDVIVLADSMCVDNCHEAQR